MPGRNLPPLERLTETVAVERPETRYARSGKVSVAYQVLGEGPPDLVFVPGVISNVEYAWQLPAIADWLSKHGL